MATFIVLYTPRAKLVAAAEANGWTDDSGESLLDAVGDHFAFEEADSEYRTLEEAVVRGKLLINEDRDFFGQVTVDEMERQLVVPEDNYWDWVSVRRHCVDETGLIETVSCEQSA